jgi:hypothetical protein
MRLAAPLGFQRFTLIAALVLIGLECAAFWTAARLTALLRPPSASPAILATFVLFWTLMTAQAMVVVGYAWTLVALARTTIDFNDRSVELEHPWRAWKGLWGSVAEVYVSSRWLHVRPKGAWRTWHVRLDDSDATGQLLRQIEEYATTAWLDDRAGRLLLLKRLVPALVAGVAIGGGAILLLNRWLARLSTGHY